MLSKESHGQVTACSELMTDLLEHVNDCGIIFGVGGLPRAAPRAGPKPLIWGPNSRLKGRGELHSQNTSPVQGLPKTET